MLSPTNLDVDVFVVILVKGRYRVRVSDPILVLEEFAVLIFRCVPRSWTVRSFRYLAFSYTYHILIASGSFSRAIRAKGMSR